MIRDFANDISINVLHFNPNVAGAIITAHIDTHDLHGVCFAIQFDAAGAGNDIDITEIEEADDAAFTINNGPVSLEKMTIGSTLIGVVTPVQVGLTSLKVGFFGTRRYVRAKYTLTIGGTMYTMMSAVETKLSLPS